LGDDLAEGNYRKSDNKRPDPKYHKYTKYKYSNTPNTLSNTYFGFERQG